jgi:6-phosphogluconolactonase
MLKKFSLVLALYFMTAAPLFAHGSFVYVTNYGDGSISQFRAKANGKLIPLKPPVIRAHGLAHCLAADPSGRFLYVTSARDWKRRDCVVSQFRIGPDGRLTPLSPPKVLVPGTPATIVVTPSGRFVYVFCREGTAAQFRIGTDGRLSPLSPLVIEVAHAGDITPIVAFDKPYHVLYGAYRVGFGENVIGGLFTLAIGRNGQLRALPGRQTLRSTSEQSISPPASISLTPSGRYAYIPESLYDKRPDGQWRDVMAQYRTRPGGILVPLSPRMVAVKTMGTSFIDPQGHFLYMVRIKTNEREGTARYCLAHARLHSNGGLGRFCDQLLDIPAPLPTSQAFFSLAFGTSDHFCYFADGNDLYLFRLHRDGSLSPLHPSRIAAGYGPLGVLCVSH